MRGVELVGLCDSDAAKARALADRFSVPDVFTDIDDLLELEALDAVVVATPNHLHEPHVLSVLAQTARVVRAAVGALGPRRRAHSRGGGAGRSCRGRGEQPPVPTDVQALERFLQGGNSGRVLGIRAGAYHMVRPDGWRARRAESGGGVFLDHGLPLLDLAMWLADFRSPSAYRHTWIEGAGEAGSRTACSCTSSVRPT